jgi:hypothetical protein
MATVFGAAAPDFMVWTWADIGPDYDELESRVLAIETLDPFLRDWSALSECVDEMQVRHFIATTQDASDQEASERNRQFLEEVYSPSREAEQRLREKLLARGLAPDGFEAVFRDAVHYIESTLAELESVAG